MSIESAQTRDLKMTAPPLDIDATKSRMKKLQTLEGLRGCPVLVYVTGTRRGMETQIAQDNTNLLADHLDAIGDVDKISLMLHTNGGDTMAAWKAVNLIRQFCKSLEVLVFDRALSAGTLISLGADVIVMTKQACLGPIDPSLTHPLGPKHPMNPAVPIPVNVEEVNGFIEFLRASVGDGQSIVAPLQALTQHVHPLVLGQTFRVRSQIRVIGNRLLSNQNGMSEERRSKILDFLCSESGSHDYPINRREAKEYLGLSIEKPNQELYTALAGTHAEIRALLMLDQPWDLKIELGNSDSAPYTARRALIESTAHGSHVFTSSGTLIKRELPQSGGPPLEVVNDNRNIEGWQFEPTPPL